LKALKFPRRNKNIKNRENAGQIEGILQKSIALKRITAWQIVTLGQ